MQEESAVSKWCAFDLFVSKDFGRHWTNLTTASGGRVASFWDFDWGANVARWQRKELGFSDETGARAWAGFAQVIGRLRPKLTLDHQTRVLLSPGVQTLSFPCEQA